MARHIRKNDQVIMLTGRDRGRQGKVLRVDIDQDMVLVQGINMHKKHLRPTQQNQRGGIIEKEMPVHVSNVAPVVDGKPTRVRFETRKDGSKVRVAVRGGQVIGTELKKAR